MIKRRTTFVLGAGASCDYGYPLGWHLLSQIVELRKRGKFFENCVEFARIPNSQLVAFKEALPHVSRPSIDAFLEQRSDLIDIGKIAIATILVGVRTSQRLWRMDLNNGNWYAHVFDQMAVGVRDAEHFTQSNEVAFITFNYDCSLELFLLRALQHNYGIDVNAACKIVKSIPILHLHGHLGMFPPEERKRGELSQSQDVKFIQKAARSIRIVHEGDQGAADFEAASRHLSGATVIFLGFGFHETNVERLGEYVAEPPKHVVASAVDLRAAERDEAERLIRHNLNIDGNHIDLHDGPCLETLREKVHLH